MCLIKDQLEKANLLTNVIKRILERVNSNKSNTNTNYMIRVANIPAKMRIKDKIELSGVWIKY